MRNSFAPKRSSSRSLSLERVSVKRARMAADFEAVSELRMTGFSRISRCDIRNMNWIDESDLNPSNICLIAYDHTDCPIGTLKITDGRANQLELEKYVHVTEFLPNTYFPLCQYSRLSVLKGPDSLNAMVGLFKSAWSWSRSERLTTIIIATPPWSKHIYDKMCFTDIGPIGEFEHPLAGNAHHVVMTLPVDDVPVLWRKSSSDWVEQFFETEHLNLEFC